MNKVRVGQFDKPGFLRQWPGLAIWAAGWLLMVLLQDLLALSSLALLLVLTTAVAALWLRLSLSLAVALLAVVAFNW